MSEPHSIVCLVPDLFFAIKIENLARRRAVAVIAPRDLAAFQVAMRQAALALIDVGSDELPWAEWIAAAKSDPHTQHTPILVFGSHVDRATRERALEAGADRFMARANFVEGLPEIIDRAARELHADPCSEPLPLGARRGIEEFNEGKYFEQHETLELVWRAETRAVRDLYRGILQVGVAFLQIERGNYSGALKIFQRAFRWLQPFRPACQGVDVERLLREATAIENELRRLGPDRFHEFDRTGFPRVHRASDT
jgi:CheY-like chemotaxis protein